MCTGSTSLMEHPDAVGESPRDVADVLVARGEMEVVTTSSGEVLYILQTIDD